METTYFRRERDDCSRGNVEGLVSLERRGSCRKGYTETPLLFYGRDPRINTPVTDTQVSTYTRSRIHTLSYMYTLIRTCTLLFVRAHSHVCPVHLSTLPNILIYSHTHSHTLTRTHPYTFTHTLTRHGHTHVHSHTYTCSIHTFPLCGTHS